MESSSQVPRPKPRRIVRRTMGHRQGPIVRLMSPRELASAFSDYVDDGSIPRDGGARLLLGTYRGMESANQYREPVAYLSVRLRDGERWTYQPFPSHEVAWLAVATGGLLVDGQSLRREMVVFEEGATPIEVLAKGDVEFVIASARQLELKVRDLQRDDPSGGPRHCSGHSRRRPD